MTTTNNVPEVRIRTRGLDWEQRVARAHNEICHYDQRALRIHASGQIVHQVARINPVSGQPFVVTVTPVLIGPIHSSHPWSSFSSEFVKTYTEHAAAGFNNCISVHVVDGEEDLWSVEVMYPGGDYAPPAIWHRASEALPALSHGVAPSVAAVPVDTPPTAAAACYAIPKPAEPTIPVAHLLGAYALAILEGRPPRRQ